LSVLIYTQYGFRSNRSTTQAILDIVTDAHENINNNEYTGLVFFRFYEGI